MLIKALVRVDFFCHAPFGAFWLTLELHTPFWCVSACIFLSFARLCWLAWLCRILTRERKLSTRQRLFFFLRPRGQARHVLTPPPHPSVPPSSFNIEENLNYYCEKCLFAKNFHVAGASHPLLSRSQTQPGLRFHVSSPDSFVFLNSALDEYSHPRPSPQGFESGKEVTSPVLSHPFRLFWRGLGALLAGCVVSCYQLTSLPRMGLLFFFFCLFRCTAQLNDQCNLIWRLPLSRVFLS